MCEDISFLSTLKIDPFPFHFHSTCANWTFETWDHAYCNRLWEGEADSLQFKIYAWMKIEAGKFIREKNIHGLALF